MDQVLALEAKIAKHEKTTVEQAEEVECLKDTIRTRRATYEAFVASATLY